MFPNAAPQLSHILKKPIKLLKGMGREGFQEGIFETYLVEINNGKRALLGKNVFNLLITNAQSQTFPPTHLSNTSYYFILRCFRFLVHFRMKATLLVADYEATTKDALNSLRFMFEITCIGSELSALHI